MSSRARAYTGLLLALAAVAVLAVAVALSYRVPAPQQAAFAPVECPTSPADLSGRTFTVGSPLPVDLKCANLRGTVFDGLDLTQADLSGADASGASFRHANLTQANLSQANLAGAHFDHATLIQATFTGANADSAWLTGADLSQADATAVRMRGADLRSTDLSQATLTGADLRSADLSSASLDQTELTRADVRGAKLWLAGSLQTHTDSMGIAAVEAGVVQLPYLVALLLLLPMAVRVVRLFRTPPDVVVPLGPPLKVAERIGWTAAGYALGAVFFYLVLGQVVAIWMVDPILPLAVAGVVFVLGRTIRSMVFRPAPARRLRVISERGVSD